MIKLVKLLASKQYFVTAIGTDIGKTYFTTSLCQILLNIGQKANIIKPVISGFTLNDDSNDTLTILNSLGMEKNIDNIDKISPFRLKLPLSPDIASRGEGVELSFDKITDFCLDNIKKSKRSNEFLFIEGAGGVMTPVTHDKTFVDLMQKLPIPVILIISNYLGSISHALTAIKVLEQCNVDLEYIILNFREGMESGTALEMLESLNRFTNKKIIVL
tara:strand:- start:5747 stop:6397 length:651 start_codon:yes stop_codon:yes gene_type:complete